MCGEKDLYGDATVREWESPPRMRGKVHSTVYADGSSRITPAYAGKRSRCTFVQRLRWDHPRVCGEKMVSMIPHRRSRGSPPRVRGKGIKRGCHSHQCGITPACAGKRRLRRRFSTLPQDHPRVCGEKNCGSKLAFRTMGSPPRMRGKAEPDCMGTLEGGITPAYAGKRSLPLMQASSSQDHPRVCGEKRSISIFSRQALGSPPRMRGKALQLPLCILDMRITPAYAGKSNTFLCKGLTARDHPRVCGEKFAT